jgi:sugar lactone lactonase YvrE
MIRPAVTAAFVALISLLAARSALADATVLASFDPTLGQIPESITSDHHGNLFFSWASTGTIQKRSPDGSITTFGMLPISAFTLGVKVGPDGCVYTVSTSLDPATIGAFVWRICQPGSVEEVAALDPSGGPNDLAFDDDGNLFVTDPFLGRVYEITPRGQVSVWLEDPLLAGNAVSPVLVFHAVGVDGIAFDARDRNLYLSNLDFGTILRVDVDHGRAGKLEVFASDPLLSGADGIAFDREGTLWVAGNAHDQILTVDRRGGVTLRASGGLLDGPSSLVFGETERDEQTLYVANSAFSRAFGFESGTPHPAILETRVRVPGLPLP